MMDINAVFDLLDHWRQLPAYQLERRADIFFSLYLSEILKDALDIHIKGTIVPEFPVKQPRTNRSDKVDYLAVTADGRKLVYVELKTDDNSLRRTQFDYLIRAASCPPHQVLEDLQQIAMATRKKTKYAALQSILEQMDLFGSQILRFPESSQVILIQPKSKVESWVTQMFKDSEVEFSVIGFNQVADIVSGHKDPISKRFSKSLRLWTPPEDLGRDGDEGLHM